MKIKKYSIGGISYTPYIPTTLGQSSKTTAETTSSNSGSSSSKSKSTTSSSATKKALLDLSKTDGITSDVYTFNNMVADFLKKSESLSEKTLFGGDKDDYSLSEVYKLQAKARQIKNNKDLFNKAFNNIEKKNAWDDIATDNYGKLYAIDVENNKITKIRSEKYLKDKDKYEPITYKQLLGIREQANSPLAFESESLIDMSSGTSTSTITNKLITALKKLGSITDETYIDTLDKDTKSKVMAAHKILYGEIPFGGPNGVYKTTNTKNIQTSVEDLCKYLYEDILDEVDRRQLSNNLAIWNQADPTRSMVYDYIKNIAAQNTSSTYRMTYQGTPDEMKAKAAGKSSSSAAGGDKKSDFVQQTLPEAYATGQGLDSPIKVNMMPWDTKTKTILNAQNCGHVMADANGHKTLEDGTLKYVLENGYGVGSITDTSHIYFGNNRLSPRDYDQIVVDNKSNMYRIFVPTKMDNGVRVPDFELNDRINKAQEDIKKMKTKDPGYINTKLRQECGPNVVWDPETETIKVDQRIMGAFLVLKGYASDKLTNIDKNDHYIHHMEREDGSTIKNWFNNIIQYHEPYGVTDTGKKKSRPINEQKNATNGRLFEGNLFLPITGQGVISQTIYQGQYVPWTTYTDVTQKAEYHNRLINGEPMPTNPTPAGVRTNF